MSRASAAPAGRGPYIAALAALVTLAALSGCVHHRRAAPAAPPAPAPSASAVSVAPAASADEPAELTPLVAGGAPVAPDEPFDSPDQAPNSPHQALDSSTQPLDSISQALDSPDQQLDWPSRALHSPDQSPDSSAAQLVGSKATVASARPGAPRPRPAPGPDPDFPAGAHILTGFDAAQPRATWQPGDQILYAVRLEKGDHSQTWYTLIRVVRISLQPGTRLTVKASEIERADSPVIATPRQVADISRTLVAPPLGGRGVQWARERGLELSPSSVLVYIEVYDQDGHPIGGVHQFIFDDYLQSGLYESCETVRRHFVSEADPTESEVRQVMLSFVSLFSLGELLWGTPHVGQIFNEVVRLPSWISILLNLGVRPAFNIRYEQAQREPRPLPALADGRGAYRVPFEITLNGEPALRCYVIAAPNQPPLQLCGGIIGLEGADVRDPQHRFTVRLLAARLGGAGRL